MHPKIAAAKQQLTGVRNPRDKGISDAQWAEWQGTVDKIAQVGHEAHREEPEAVDRIAGLVQRGNQGKLEKREWLRQVTASEPDCHWSDVTVNQVTFSCGCSHYQWFRDSEPDDGKVIRHHQALSLCDRHKHLSEKAAWQASLDESDKLAAAQE